MIVLLAWLAAAGPLTLDQALDRAAERPTVAAADHEARAARADATAAWLGAMGPRIGGTLTTTSRTREIAISTPIGAFVQQPKDVVDAGLRASWPLVEPAGVLGRAPAANAAARAQQDRARRTRDTARVEAGEAFLDLVVAQARHEALGRLVESLLAREDQASSLVEAGLSVPADRLRVRVALAEARAGEARAREGVEAARQALGWRLGAAAPSEVAFAWTPPPVPPAVEEVATQALLARPDLAALEHQVTALGRQRAVPLLESLPTVAAWGQITATDNEALVDNRWVEGGLDLRWTGLAGGSRAARSRAGAERLRAARARLDDARRGVTAELHQARAALVAALAEVEAREAAVADAREAARVLGRRYGEGLVPLTDVLEVEASRARQEAEQVRARADATAAWLRWRLATGQPVRVGPGSPTGSG